MRRRLGFDGVPHDYATTLNKGHGRIERRECRAISDPSLRLEYLRTGKDWPGLRSVVRVVGRRDTGTDVTVQPRYYISSLDVAAERCSRRHGPTGAIANSLPAWVTNPGGRRMLDHSPENMAAASDIPQPAEAGNQPWEFRANPGWLASGTY